MHLNLLVMLSMSQLSAMKCYLNYLKLHDEFSSVHFFVLFYHVCLYSVVRDNGFIIPSASQIY